MKNAILLICVLCFGSCAKKEYYREDLYYEQRLNGILKTASEIQITFYTKMSSPDLLGEIGYSEICNYRDRRKWSIERGYNEKTLLYLEKYYYDDNGLLELKNFDINRLNGYPEFSEVISRKDNKEIWVMGYYYTKHKESTKMYLPDTTYITYTQYTTTLEKHKSGKLSEIVITQIDEKGNIINKTTKDAKGSEEQVSYFFNERGWVSRMEVEKTGENKQVARAICTIEYSEIDGFENWRRCVIYQPYLNVYTQIHRRIRY